MRYKPDSGIGKMWAAYESGGGAAATAIGVSLGLASSTVKTRVDGWEREKRGGGPAPTTIRTPRAQKVPYVQTSTKPRVKCTYMPGRLGYLIVDGLEVSEVRWDDDFPEIYIINKYLKKVKHKEK